MDKFLHKEYTHYAQKLVEKLDKIEERKQKLVEKLDKIEERKKYETFQ